MKYLIALGKILLTVPVSLLIAYTVDGSAATFLSALAGIPFGVWSAIGLLDAQR